MTHFYSNVASHPLPADITVGQRQSPLEARNMAKVVGPRIMAERDNMRSSSHFLPCSELEARHTFQEGCEIKVVRI